MGMKKAWIYDCSVPDAIQEELGECSRSTSPSSLVFPNSRSYDTPDQDESHTLCAFGDLSQDETYWLRVSVASRAQALRLRMKKTKGRRSNSLDTNHLYEKDRKESAVAVDVVKSETVLSPTTTHARSYSGPITLNTVQDLINILDERKVGGLWKIRAASNPSSPTSADSSTSHTSTTLTSDGESESETDSEKQAQHAAEPAKDVQNLISFFSSTPRERAASLRRLKQGCAADARFATFTAFAAYHEENEKKLWAAAVANDEDDADRKARAAPADDSDSDRDSASPIIRRTLGPVFVSSPNSKARSLARIGSRALASGRAPHRKPIPTWY